MKDEDESEKSEPAELSNSNLEQDKGETICKIAKETISKTQETSNEEPPKNSDEDDFLFANSNNKPWRPSKETLRNLKTRSSGGTWKWRNQK